MRKLVLIAALSVAAVGAIAGTASAATAATGAGTIKDYATVYTSPSNTSIPIHHLGPGEKVETHCFREGQVLNGNPYWFVIETDGEVGYVHRDSIVPPPDLRHC